MKEFIRNRTIRPSSRDENSKSYKIDTRLISRDDFLIVNIDHETNSYQKSFKFYGSDVADRDSISFRVNDFDGIININWSGIKPIDLNSVNSKHSSKFPGSNVKKEKVNIISESNLLNKKNSFDSVSNSETKILVIGTMPGNISLLKGEYYCNPRNRFWKNISNITKRNLPLDYNGKLEMLLNAKIGIWDVAFKATRKGSLDRDIENVEPNYLESFIEMHKNIRNIVFNGQKAENLFNKYFERKYDIKYISMPSTSSTNTHYDDDELFNIWQEILVH